jgi:antitoxin YqcF
MEITEGLPDLRCVVRTQAARAFGARGEASFHSGGAGADRLEVLACAHSPLRNVTSYATVGLSNRQLYRDGEVLPVRLELVTAAYEGFPHIPAALASAAFRIIHDRRSCEPGVVFPDVPELTYISSTLTDLYFTSPFLWGGALMTVHLGPASLAWLLAVPIGRSESVYAVAHGPLELEKRLEDSGIDFFDWNREAIV